MKLVFAHGINQQDKDETTLREEWEGHLFPLLKVAGLDTQIEVETPFYGKRLYELTAGIQSDHVVPQGIGGADGTGDEEAEFIEGGLNEIAAADPHVDEAKIKEVLESGDASILIGQGFPMHRRINAIVRAFERFSPVHGDWTLHLLKQAYTYLRKPGADDEIDAIVAPHFSNQSVIVSHSLGTVVTFRLLRRMALEGRPVDVPLLITVGSPLSLRTVRKALGPSYAKPKGVGRWLNAYDPDDFICLGQGLTAQTFSDEIENIADIENVPGNAHAIEGYLKDPRIVAAIRGAF